MSNLSTATTMSRRNLLFGGALLAAAGTAIATTGCSGAGTEDGSTRARRLPTAARSAR